MQEEDVDHLVFCSFNDKATSLARILTPSTIGLVSSRLTALLLIIG